MPEHETEQLPLGWDVAFEETAHSIALTIRIDPEQHDLMWLVAGDDAETVDDAQTVSFAESVLDWCWGDDPDGPAECGRPSTTAVGLCDACFARARAQK